MASAAANLPCDGDGVCMVCKAAPPPEVELLRCRTCATPWHAPCLSKPPASLAATAEWHCPDCLGDAAPAAAGAGSELVAAIRAIEADASLSDQEKARRRQQLLAGGSAAAAEADGDEDASSAEKAKGWDDDVLAVIGNKFSCTFCMKLPERPVTTPCGHNFCLRCFQRWIYNGKRTCGKCRTPIPSKMASQPRINASLVEAIRMAKAAKNVNSAGSTNVYQYIRNDDRPDKAFTTERAKRAGKANACSGQIFVTIAPDHFGPILAENDPKRNIGVRVGELWEDRMECRQWGAHFPHVAGIAGQSNYGAQSVALSGGYADDEDHGEWFLYTGSGGRDLSGNKRTNKEQSFDQKFEKLNAALRVSCLKGYPVRVVRSHKEKRSSYAPESGVRYDGIYRIEKCWRKTGIQGNFKVCRYLFVRCDNEPAPWTSDDHGDRPRPLPKIRELAGSTDITERNASPAWDYDEKGGWKWMKPAPISRKPVLTGKPELDKKARKEARRAQNLSVTERLLKEFSCSVCRTVMKEPLTTPCGHNFCKTCLLGAYDNESHMRERSRGGRTLRAQKIVKKCPSCPTDICDFLRNPQINRELMDLIESLQRKAEEEGDVQPNEDCSGAADISSDSDEENDDDAEENDDGSLNEEERNGAEDKKIESADGDSDVNAADSSDKVDIDDKKQAPQSRKRKANAELDGGVEGNAVSGRGGRKTRKSAELDAVEGNAVSGGGGRKTRPSAEVDGVEVNAVSGIGGRKTRNSAEANDEVEGIAVSGRGGGKTRNSAEANGGVEGNAVSDRGGRRTRQSARANGGVEANAASGRDGRRTRSSSAANAMEIDGEKEMPILVEGDKNSEVADAESP